MGSDGPAPRGVSQGEHMGLVPETALPREESPKGST